MKLCFNAGPDPLEEYFPFAHENGFPWMELSCNNTQNFLDKFDLPKKQTKYGYSRRLPKCNNISVYSRSQIKGGKLISYTGRSSPSIKFGYRVRDLSKPIRRSVLNPSLLFPVTQKLALSLSRTLSIHRTRYGSGVPLSLEQPSY